MKTNKKYITRFFLVLLLSVNFILVSCGQGKNKFSSLVGEGDFYCGLSDDGRAKCWRYILQMERSIENNVVLSKPFVLDQLSVPKEISAQSFDKLEMRSGQKKIQSVLVDKYIVDSWIRVCGMATGKKPACWDYEPSKAAQKPFDLGAVADFSQASLFDFGTVGFMAAPAVTGRGLDFQASLFCYVNAGDEQKYICHDSISGTKLESSVGEKIAQLSVGGMVCAGTVSDKILCSALVLNQDDPSPKLTSPIDISTGKFSSILSFPIPSLGKVVGCMISADHKAKCTVLAVDPDLTISPRKLIATPFPLPADLADRQISYLNYDYALDLDHRLIKIKGFDRHDPSGIGEDVIPAEIKDKRYASWAAGKNTACGVERDSKEVSCFKISAQTNTLTSVSIMAP